MKGSLRIACALLAGLIALAAPRAQALNIVIVNMDGAGEGFNDPTPASPVGGNNGTTVGQQRLNVFQEAGNIWGNILPGSTTVRVQASFDVLTCSMTSAVLGSAGPIDIEANFPGAEFNNTWYHVSLANRLAGSDLEPSRNDIQAQFNSALNGQASCLNGVGWYYGFDHNEGSNIDLLPVVLHELGHGLGFSTNTSGTTGNFAGGLPSVYDRYILDNTNNLHWTQMTAAQRVASAINTGHLVWDGPAVRGQAPNFLGPPAILVINSPGAIAGTYDAGTASFGPVVTLNSLTGTVVLADDGAAPNSDACSALVNGAQVSGKIALIDRGTCPFAFKVKQAQNAGAIGVIIANNVAGSTPPGMGGSDPTITIPVLSVTQTLGNSIKAQLGAGVNVTFSVDPSRLAGADSQKRVLLFAPNPFQGGSSVSHWDVSATPNLLMEPAITGDLTSSVDLTRYHFQDIGWFGPTTDATAEAGPRATRLLGNVPNPFNPSTTVRFELARDGAVELDVFDLAGRHVKKLLHSNLAAGVHPVVWNGTNNAGRRVPSGVYFYRLKAGDHVESRRMVLLK